MNIASEDAERIAQDLSETAIENVEHALGRNLSDAEWDTAAEYLIERFAEALLEYVW